MLKKSYGLTTLELLLCLATVSSITAYTLNMSEEVETQIEAYQKLNDAKTILNKKAISHRIPCQNCNDD